METSLDTLVKSTEQEILDLKTYHKVKSEVKIYQYSFNIAADSPTRLWQVTYASGNQPIISFMANLDGMMGTPTGTTQLVITAPRYYATTAVIFSTRPIQSVVMLQ